MRKLDIPLFLCFGFQKEKGEVGSQVSEKLSQQVRGSSFFLFGWVGGGGSGEVEGQLADIRGEIFIKHYNLKPNYHT